MARHKAKGIDFDQLVAHGIGLGAHCTHGLPGSFSYAGHTVSHENGDSYLIETRDGPLRFSRGDRLVTDAKGRLSVHGG